MGITQKQRQSRMTSSPFIINLRQSQLFLDAALNCAYFIHSLSNCGKLGVQIGQDRYHHADLWLGVFLQCVGDDVDEVDERAVHFGKHLVCYSVIACGEFVSQSRGVNFRISQCGFRQYV